jgi:hypothetical protein
MRTKKSRATAESNIQSDFAAHVKANRRAHEWAAKCIAYRDADKPALAKNAEQKARHWLRQAMILEAKGSGRSRLVNRI